ncbi:hypothetical protein ACROYT_G015285 [Oculina patagonica]
MKLIVFSSKKTDLMAKGYFDEIISSVKSLCSFDELGKTRSVGVHSFKLKLGYSLKKCIAILTSKALREKDDDLLSDQKHLEKLMDSEWNDRISHHSLATFHGRKFNQVDLICWCSFLQTEAWLLTQNIAILTGKALREKDDDLLSDQQHLEKLMDSEWNDRISHHSLATFHGRKFNQVDLLPLTEDLEKLSPVQRPGKSWEKMELPDHDWQHLTCNTITPMAHLFVKTENIYLKDIINVQRSETAATTLNFTFLSTKR